MESRPTFVAIDFETAHTDADSACALAAIRCEAGRIVAREVSLLRPPRREPFMFTEIHGLTWKDVASAPRFAEGWARFEPLLEGAAFIAAHNARFDRGVLGASLARVGIAAPPLPFLCTVKLARKVFDIYPTKLPLVCEALDIPLTHHDPASDAEACARIVLAAGEQGDPLEPTDRPILLA